MPVSRTDSTRSSASVFKLTSTEPPLRVNLIAFDRRFQATCCKRSGSTASDPMARSRWRSMVMCLAAAAGLSESTAASINGRIGVDFASICSLPDTIREMSSRSSISCD